METTPRRLFCMTMTGRWTAASLPFGLVSPGMSMPSRMSATFREA
jgi:hypothetical protein